MEAHDIIIRPIITEKTMDGNTQKNTPSRLRRTLPR